MLREGWGVLPGHQWGHNLATSGQLYMAMDSPDVPPQLPLTANALTAIGGGLPVPTALSLFASQRDLQHRVRSATGCYLDLGDLRAPTSRPGGYLVHFLSDQQWVRHWLLYLGSGGNEGVVTTEAPIGFDLSRDPGCQNLPPDQVGLEGAGDLDLCAPNFARFLYRFSEENELHFALSRQRLLSGAVKAYADQRAAIAKAK